MFGLVQVQFISPNNDGHSSWIIVLYIVEIFPLFHTKAKMNNDR